MNELDQTPCCSLNSFNVGTEPPQPAEPLDSIVKGVFDAISPVWPLRDYVAVNPYFGLRQYRFMEARSYLQVFSDCELLMPLSYYALQYQRADFDRDDIACAVAELAEAGLRTELTLAEITARLEAQPMQQATLDQPAAEFNSHRRIYTIAEIATQLTGVDWTDVVRNELSKFCACHYDKGQASWPSPWRHLPLYQAWCGMASRDRSLDSLGMGGFRDYVKQLPSTAEAAIEYSLKRLNIPRPLWSTFLLCQSFSIPGWSAWTKYQDSQKAEKAAEDFVGLMAMRLAYDVVIGESFRIRAKWDEFVRDDAACFPRASTSNDAVLRNILLRASEIGFRKTLLRSLTKTPVTGNGTSRKLAQLVFCIDVRSERIRRQLESVTSEIETFGFAGFFGMPMAYVPVGESSSVAQLPVLLQPQFEVREGLQAGGGACSDQIERLNQRLERERVDIRSWRRLWLGFQSSSVGCFSFVEITGILFGFSLLRRALGWPASDACHRDGVDSNHQQSMGPTLRGLEQQGVTLERQIALAEGMLTNLGLRKNFSRLVVFCGHASQTANNPLAAGLDCGACGGHSGKPNARFAALLLNQPQIRFGLEKRGIAIPPDTYFLAAVHNTTTDQIEFCDLEQLPASHRNAFQRLEESIMAAAARTRMERLPSLAGTSVSDLMQRAADWSEVRPEWALAGNAAFIAAPRHMTLEADLGGRAFLHSYEHALDVDGRVLEQIMTAPLVVANWINMQYYASTVDNHHFGSGNKAVHNVVGQFGILSGNGGDLQTGLPWQSVHSGDRYQHSPLRLQVVIAAPRAAIARVLAKHDLVANLVTNDWLHLVSIESDGRSYGYTAQGAWAAI